MQGTISQRLIGERECFIYLPSNHKPNHPVLYVHDGESFLQSFKVIISSLEQEYFNDLPIIVAISTNDRLADYTPWAAKALSNKFPDFKGEADRYLTYIEKTVKPFIDNEYSTLSDFSDTYLMGFSLGGLVSLYATFKTHCFGNIISISGSFWYPNWIEYIEKNNILNPTINLLLLAGKNEGRNKVTIQKDSFLFATQTHEILQLKLNRMIPFFLDEGEHHDFQSERYLKALQWICQQENLKNKMGELR